jgi:L-fuculose-phosphate aldolase
VAATEGNLSVRLADGRLLVTPRGRRKDELLAEELIVIAPGTASEGESAPNGALEPTSDLAIHRAVMAARPDVGAVVHAHPVVSMALTLAGEVPQPAVLPETALFVPVLPVVPFAEMGSEELAAKVATTFGGPTLPRAAILERHGAIAVGDAALGPEGALRQAVDRLELVEVLCRAWRDALLLRAARAIVGRG